MSRISALVFQLLPLLLLVTMATSELEPPSNIQIRNFNGNLVALWNWDISSTDDDTVVTFTAFYHKSGMPPIPIPGCSHTEAYICHIPPHLLDFSESYTLLVKCETAEEGRLSDPIDFNPNLIETVPPPNADVVFDDGIVIVNISTLHLYSSYNMDGCYVIVLQSNESSEKNFTSPSSQYVIPKISPGTSYCIRVQLVNLLYGLRTPFSPANCFTTQPEGSPKNLRVEAINLKYLLKWDWDYEQHPNVTFSVQKRNLPDGAWETHPSCQNITTNECDVSDLGQFYSRYAFRTFVYDGQRDAFNHSVVHFSPVDDGCWYQNFNAFNCVLPLGKMTVVMGPPTIIINTTSQNNDLYITVSAPEGFRDEGLHSVCVWLYHLEFWKNSTPNQVLAEKKREPHFHMEAPEASTTYCMRSRISCPDDENRSGLYSGIQCITTGPRSYMIEWITGSIFLGIIVISVAVYICLYPLKRYMNHIFFPSSKLPSSIGKDIQDLSRNLIRAPFALNKEETFDRFYIIENNETEIQVQNDKKSQDSGNYSNEDEHTGETDICT